MEGVISRHLQVRNPQFSCLDAEAAPAGRTTVGA